MAIKSYADPKDAENLPPLKDSRVKHFVRGMKEHHAAVRKYLSSGGLSDAPIAHFKAAHDARQEFHDKFVATGHPELEAAYAHLNHYTSLSPADQRSALGRKAHAEAEEPPAGARKKSHAE